MSENMEYKPNVKVEGKQMEERRHVVAFKRPYMFEQKEYTEVDLSGLDALIEEKTGITTMIAEDPLTAVAIGTGKFIEFAHGEGMKNFD